MNFLNIASLHRSAMPMKLKLPLPTDPLKEATKWRRRRGFPNGQGFLCLKSFRKKCDKSTESRKHTFLWLSTKLLYCIWWCRGPAADGDELYWPVMQQSSSLSKMCVCPTGHWVYIYETNEWHATKWSKTGSVITQWTVTFFLVDMGQKTSSHWTEM